MTMHIGTLGEALLRALGRTENSGTRLAKVSDTAIRRHAPSLGKAADEVERAVRADPVLLLEILDAAHFTRAIVERSVARRARRIGTGLRAEGAGHGGIDSHLGNACPDEHQDAAQAAGGGHCRRGAQRDFAPADNAAPRGQRDRVSAKETPNGVMPGHARRTGRAAAGAARATRRTVLDLLRVNGQPLRAVTAGEALGFAEKSRTDAATIERICAGLDDTRPVGDQITDDEAERRAGQNTETR